ncbi:DUF302 domain-containing protein [Phenylobacterium conjunctum]|uniref:DUF302 domain-containing protein n=1 Tax=Phenylobacterium conjunctum TaxID=1298959 RepID=A0ABW3T1K4_9CAUL
MAYYFATTLPVAFEEAVQRATDALKAEGFGVITQIDVRATFKDKLGVDFRDHRILGACNPAMAHEALQLEDKVGAMLPCHVVVQALGPRRTEVAAIDPVASMQAIDNPQLKLAAAQVQARLKRVVEGLSAACPLLEQELDRELADGGPAGDPPSLTEPAGGARDCCGPAP